MVFGHVLVVSLLVKSEEVLNLHSAQRNAEIAGAIFEASLVDASQSGQAANLPRVFDRIEGVVIHDEHVEIIHPHSDGLMGN
jgi:hypothetical protein